MGSSESQHESHTEFVFLHESHSRLFLRYLTWKLPCSRDPKDQHLSRFCISSFLERGNFEGYLHANISDLVFKLKTVRPPYKFACLVSKCVQSNFSLSGTKRCWSPQTQRHYRPAMIKHSFCSLLFPYLLFTWHDLSESNSISGQVQPGQAERPRPLPEGGHSDRESGDGDGAPVSDWGWGPAADRRQAHPGDPPQRRH